MSDTKEKLKLYKEINKDILKDLINNHYDRGSIFGHGQGEDAYTLIYIMYFTS